MGAYSIILKHCIAKGIPLAAARVYAYHQSTYSTSKRKPLDPVKCNKMCDANCNHCHIYPAMQRRQRKCLSKEKPTVT